MIYETFLNWLYWLGIQTSNFVGFMFKPFNFIIFSIAPIYVFGFGTITLLCGYIMARSLTV